MKRTSIITLWAVLATALLAISLVWPDSARDVLEPIGKAVRVSRAEAQTQDAPAQLEWLGWQFFRLTSPRGKIILFNPALNDAAALFRNRESPLSLENIEAAHLVLVTAGHADDQGMAAEVVRKTGAQLVTTFELASWMVARGVESGKILRGGPGSRFEVDGIRIQVVHAVHGSGAPSLPGQPNLAVYGGPALGFIVTLENGVKVYHAGSTALTQDLALYGRVYKPHIALLPTGSGMPPDEAAIGAELLMTDNPNLHSVFPQHHSAWAHPAALQGPAFVRAVQGHRYRRELAAFDPKPGQVFTINASGTRAR